MFDVAAFYSKWMTDLEDSQRPSGSIPDVSPNYWQLYNDDLTWPGTIIFVHGMLYDQYADKRVLARGYDAMKKWIDYEKTFVKDGLISKDQYADWCVPPEDPKLIHSQGSRARYRQDTDRDQLLLRAVAPDGAVRADSGQARRRGRVRPAGPRRRRTSSNGASSNWRAACTTTARRHRACCRCTSGWCRRISVRPWCRRWCAISNRRATIMWVRAWWARSG